MKTILLAFMFGLLLGLGFDDYRHSKTAQLRLDVKYLMFENNHLKAEEPQSWDSLQLRQMDSWDWDVPNLSLPWACEGSDA